MKVVANRNEAAKKSQQPVDNGYGNSSADVEARENEAEEEAQQSVANAEAMPLSNRQGLGGQEVRVLFPNMLSQAFIAFVSLGRIQNLSSLIF